MRATQARPEVKHCCRMDNHVPHLWHGHYPLRDVEYFCMGVRIHEGGFGVHVH